MLVEKYSGLLCLRMSERGKMFLSLTPGWRHGAYRSVLARTHWRFTVRVHQKLRQCGQVCNDSMDELIN